MGQQLAIKAIETVYKGWRFRSRLEARWAVFFDVLGLEYVYEPEGFDLGELGWYLPDFWFPLLECYGEVKPKTLTEIEYAKAAALPRPCLLFDVPAPRPMGHYPAGLCEETTYRKYLANDTYWPVLLESSISKRRLYFSFGELDWPECCFWLSNVAAVEARGARFQ